MDVTSGEILTAPTFNELTATAQHLLSAADADDDKATSGEAVSCPQWALYGRSIVLKAARQSMEESASAPERAADRYCLHR